MDTDSVSNFSQGQNLQDLVDSIAGGADENWAKQMQLPSTLFCPFTSEDAMDFGFFREVKGNRASVSNVPSTSLSRKKICEDFAPVPVVDRSISFTIGRGFPGETDLQILYPEERTRSFAKIVRDLQVVAGYHVNELTDKEALFPCSATNKAFPRITPPNNLLFGFKRVVQLIKDLEGILIETIDCGRVNASFQEVECSPQKNLIPSDTHWTNLKTGVFVSKIVARYSMLSCSVRPRELEVADYCLALNNNYSDIEPIFSDNLGLSLVRKHVRSIDLTAYVEPSVVNAYARVCIHNWKVLGITFRTTLDVVTKESAGVTDVNLVSHWISWLSKTSSLMEQAVLVTIPLYMDGEYCLILVDFNRQLIQLIDSVLRQDRGSWDDFAASTVQYFAKLLVRVGDQRGVQLNEYSYSVVNTTGSSGDAGPDSGIVTMHLLHLIGDENYPMHSFNFSEEIVRIGLRVGLLERIVSSKANKLCEDVLARVRTFIQQKISRVLTPTDELRDWLQIYNNGIH